MNDYFMKDIEEIHEYLFNKDGMRLGQRIKTNFNQLERQLNNIEKKLNKIEKKSTMTYGEFLIYLGIIFIAFFGAFAWILLS